MGRIEKTVFISYRRTNIPWALAIYQNLTAHGYDVFFDYDSIPSGDFEQVILGNIRARAHFLVVLTPSALERCVSPDDWLRREIETALDEKRNIVPIFLEGFDFGSPSISKYLTGKLATLKKYNGQKVPAGFFDEAMGKIREKFLNVPLDAVLHPIPTNVQEVIRKQQVAANNATKVKEKLVTQEETKKGYKSTDDERPIQDVQKIKVFLCHSSKDKPLVRELYKRLINDGFDIWFDEEKLLPGQNWRLEITNAVATSDAVIVCLSTNLVNKEGYVQKELQLVLDMAQEKPEGVIFMIPIRLDECTVPKSVSIYQYVDFFPTDYKNQAYKRIANSLDLRARYMLNPK